MPGSPLYLAGGRRPAFVEFYWLRGGQGAVLRDSPFLLGVRGSVGEIPVRSPKPSCVRLVSAVVARRCGRVPA